MTKRQEEIIKDNLRAYKANFDFIKIEDADYGGGFYVFTSEEREKNGDCTQYCYNIDYLIVLLQGGVQASYGIMKRKQEE